MRSLNVVTMRADTLLGDGAFGNPAYTGTGQVGAVAGNVRLPAITAITKDSRDNLYWTDALGGVRSYNTSSGVTSNYCAVPTNASSCIRLSGSAPSTSTTYNCSRLCLGSATTGLAMDVSSRIVYVAYNDTQGVGSVLLSILPSGVALWWCGVGVNGAGNGVDSKCQQTELFAPQHLQVYGGALFYLEPSVPYVGWVSLTYTGNHSNGGALLSCSGSSRRGGGSSCPSWTGSTALTSPSAMAVDSSTGWLYLAEINSIVVCQITGGTNPTCSQSRILARTHTPRPPQRRVIRSALLPSSLSSPCPPCALQPRSASSWVTCRPTWATWMASVSSTPAHEQRPLSATPGGARSHSPLAPSPLLCRGAQ